MRRYAAAFLQRHHTPSPQIQRRGVRVGQPDAALVGISARGKENPALDQDSGCQAYRLLSARLECRDQRTSRHPLAAFQALRKSFGSGPRTANSDSPLALQVGQMYSPAEPDTCFSSPVCTLICHTCPRFSLLHVLNAIRLPSGDQAGVICTSPGISDVSAWGVPFRQIHLPESAQGDKHQLTSIWAGGRPLDIAHRYGAVGIKVRLAACLLRNHTMHIRDERDDVRVPISRIDPHYFPADRYQQRRSLLVHAKIGNMNSE